ncbi:low choriolytic enzyme-like isoform X2 [Chiloscyllium punctatum]|uniref:low choriolytic enzyme-like isoform X2 n=1 Tax=Chiloscyllium punctatum TaxID=137246 RepID=UPI003B63D3BE
MDLTTAVLLVLSLMYTYTKLVDNMNSPFQDDVEMEQLGVNEQDIFHIISNTNKELLKHTGGKVIEYGDILVDNSRNAAMCKNNTRNCLWPSSHDGNVYIPYALQKDYNFETWF